MAPKWCSPIFSVVREVDRLVVGNTLLGLSLQDMLFINICFPRKALAVRTIVPVVHRVLNPAASS